MTVALKAICKITQSCSCKLSLTHNQQNTLSKFSTLSVFAAADLFVLV